jgi:hypothetical protein
MDIVVGFMQMACFVGLAYGLYLVATSADPVAPPEPWRKLQRRHFVIDPPPPAVNSEKPQPTTPPLAAPRTPAI